MPSAEWNLVVEVGSSAVIPVLDVVNLTSMKGHVAIGYRAGRVHGLEGPSLIGRGQTFGSSDVDGNAASVEHDGDDVGLAGQATDGFDGQFDAKVGSARAVRGETRVRSLCERVEIDVDHDFGPWSE